MKLLVVEDEHKIAFALKRGLEYEGYVSDVAHDSDQAFALLQSGDYDVLILDWMIPGRHNGIELCREIRRAGNQAGILLLTARNTIGDRVTGLDSGADDYLAKPFAFEELLARVRALLRRPKDFSGITLSLGSLTVDTVHKTVTRVGKSVEITAKEYALLVYLVQANGRVVSKKELMDHIWSDEYRPLPNTIEAFIKRLREKIDRPFPKEPALIQTQRGFGYRLEAGL